MPGPPDSRRRDTHTHCWDCGTFYLDAIGPCRPQHVIVRCCRHRRQSNEHVDRVIEHAWQQRGTGAAAGSPPRAGSSGA